MFTHLHFFFLIILCFTECVVELINYNTNNDGVVITTSSNPGTKANSLLGSNSQWIEAEDDQSPQISFGILTEDGSEAPIYDVKVRTENVDKITVYSTTNGKEEEFDFVCYH